MKLSITDARVWYLWMIAGLLTGIAFGLNAHLSQTKHQPAENYFIACYVNRCFS